MFFHVLADDDKPDKGTNAEQKKARWDTSRKSFERFQLIDTNNIDTDITGYFPD